jgi:predicted MFS family arabinose efflux permease
MRASYAVLATTLMVLAFTGMLRPLAVFIIAAIGGLVRPADLAMRGALVAETMPPDRFVSAMGAARTTSDSARTVGSLVGAGLFALLGLGPAYVAITTFYLTGLLLTFGVGNPRQAIQMAARNSLWRDLREGLDYLWDTPSSLAALLLAFLVNLTAFPMTSGLLPYVARDIYHVDQTGLGYLISSFAFGSLLGSILISIIGRSVRPARMMVVFALGWYAMLLVFVHMPDPTSGCLTLMCAGVAQSLSLVPMSAMLLHGAGAYRGRVMGMRMLAIYGLPLGLMAAGTLIERIGFVSTATGYCVAGMVLTLLIALRWRNVLWPLHAAANAR